MSNSLKRIKSMVKKNMENVSLPKKVAMFVMNNLIEQIMFLRSNDNGLLYQTLPPKLFPPQQVITYVEKITMMEHFLSNFSIHNDQQLEAFLVTLNRAKILSDPTHLNHQMLFKIIYFDTRTSKKTEIQNTASHSYNFYYDHLPHHVRITNLENPQAEERFELTTSDELTIQNDIYLRSFHELGGEAIAPRILCGVSVDDELLEMLKGFPDFPYTKLFFLLHSGFIRPYLVIMEMVEKRENKDNYLFQAINVSAVVRSSKEYVTQNVQVMTLGDEHLHFEPPISSIKPLGDLSQMLTMLFSLQKMYEYGYVHADLHVGNGYYSLSGTSMMNVTKFGKSTIFDFSRSGAKHVELQAMWNKFKGNEYLTRPREISSYQSDADLLEKPSILQENTTDNMVDDFLRLLVPYITDERIKYYIQMFRLFSSKQPILQKSLEKYAEALRENAMVILFNFFPYVFNAPEQYPPIQLDILSASYAWMVHLMQLFVTNNEVLVKEINEMENSQGENLQSFYSQYNKLINISRPVVGGKSSRKRSKSLSLSLRKSKTNLSPPLINNFMNKQITMESLFEKYNHYVLECNRTCIELL